MGAAIEYTSCGSAITENFGYYIYAFGDKPVPTIVRVVTLDEEDTDFKYVICVTEEYSKADTIYGFAEVYVIQKLESSNLEDLRVEVPEFFI